MKHKKSDSLAAHKKREEKMFKNIQQGIKRVEKEEKKEHHSRKHHSKPKHHSKVKRAKKVVRKARKIVAKRDKVKKVMHEFKHHELHSGSKKGPVVRNPKQAIAIALSEARRRKKK